MSTDIFDGREAVSHIEQQLRPRIERVTQQRGFAPGLLSVLVGDDLSSHQFINIKEKKATSLGIRFERKHYPANFDPRKVVNFIRESGERNEIDGILIQLPLPTQFDRSLVLKAIHPYKDVDGLHPKNLGLLLEGKAFFVPPAVLSVHEVLISHHVDLTGKEVVLVGSGLLVGKPLALYFSNEGATVTMCNVHTQDLANHTRRADIIVSSTGEAEIISADMVKEGAVLIDFGGKQVDGLLKGEFGQDVYEKAALVTPVPGGIGPLTVAKLLENTVLSAERATFHE